MTLGRLTTAKRIQHQSPPLIDTYKLTPKLNHSQTPICSILCICTCIYYLLNIQNSHALQFAAVSFVAVLAIYYNAPQQTANHGSHKLTHTHTHSRIWLLKRGHMVCCLKIIYNNGPPYSDKTARDNPRAAFRQSERCCVVVRSRGLFVGVLGRRRQMSDRNIVVRNNDNCGIVNNIMW